MRVRITLTALGLATVGALGVTAPAAAAEAPCIGLPAKVNVGSVVGLVPVSVQNIPILSNPQIQQCTENSTQAKGDAAV